MEEPLHLGGSARQEPGKRKIHSGLAHSTFLLPSSIPPSRTPAPTLTLMAPGAGRGRESGGRLSRDHAARRRRGSRADARCQGGVQGKWPGLNQPERTLGWVERTFSPLTL